jgi:hypothetical protein
VRSGYFDESAAGLARPAELIVPTQPGSWWVQKDWWLGGEAAADSSAPLAYEQLTVTPLADGTGLVSFVLASEERIAGVDEDDNTGPCGTYPTLSYQGERYHSLATDHQVLVQAWVPLRAAGQAETEPILLVDPIISTVVPSDRSEPC